MDNDMYELSMEIQKIKNMGYVKGVYPTGNCAGITFERLLGKDSDELPFADYNGIELKTKKGYSRSRVTLFSANPDGRYVYALQNLYEKYGRNINGEKRFLLEINSLKKHFFNNHFFQISVDKEEKEIILNVYDINYNLIDNDTRWSFDLIKERLDLKLNKLALVKCCTKSKNRQQYYWYYKVTFYRTIIFDKFIEAIEKGKINIKFTIGVFKTGPRVGQIHNHGTGFSIDEQDLKFIYKDIF